VKTFLLGTAATAAAVLVCVALTLPPRRLTLPPASDRTVPGILHVHTNRSDGLSSPDEVAAAAARAGLKFLVFTDHGDATRPPDAPAYRSGVLCLVGVEISTTAGHYVAIDMPAAPYPLAGEPRDVVEDVRRLGGFGIVAHPDSPKPQLRWGDWTVPFDGVELLNLDTSWRLLAEEGGWASKGRLLAAFLDYPFRAPETMTRLIQPTAVLREWEALARRRRLVTIAGADAHSRLAPRSADPGDSRLALPLPGYEASFRVMSVHVRTEQPLSGAAAADAALLMRAIRNGHLYTAVDGIASPPSFEFTAANALGSVREGDVLAPGGPVLLHVQSNAPAGFSTVVHDGTRTLSSVRDTQDLTVHAGDAPAVYWAEIVSPVGSPSITWVRSNPIYVRGHDPRTSAPVAAPVLADARRVFDGSTANGWSVEHDSRSSSAVDVAPAVAAPELQYRFGLADGRSFGQFASLVLNLPNGVAGYDALRFTIRAEKPMRLSLQFRDTTADRWQRSIYADVSSRDRTVTFDDFVPVGATHVPKAAKADIRSMMFVVDTTNTKPGTAGRFWVGGPSLVTFAR
jgi:hypothetical protein